MRERRKSQEDVRLTRLMTDNVVALAEEITLERLVAAEKTKTEKVTTPTTEDGKRETNSVVKNTNLQPHVPTFLLSLTRKVRYRSKLGRDYIRCPRYANEIVIMCIDLMVRNDVFICMCVSY